MSTEKSQTKSKKRGKKSIKVLKEDILSETLVNDHEEKDTMAFREVGGELGGSCMERDILLSLPEGVLVIDEDYNVIFANDAAANFLDRMPEECVGLKCYNLINSEHCNTRQCKLKEVIEQNRVVTTNATVNLVNEKLSIKYKLAPFKRSGDIAGVIATVEETSEDMLIVDEVESLVESVIEGKLDERAVLENFDGNNQRILGAINDLIDAFVNPIRVTANYVNKISDGNIPEKITKEYKGEFNEIKSSLNQCIDVMNGLLSETDTLIQATLNGELDTRANAEQFPGGWGKLVEGINDLIEAFVEPIRITADYVNKISDGNIPEKITKEYKGEFNEIKTSLNQCIDVMNGLLRETDTLIQATLNGELDTRANAEQFPGGWGKLVEGINDLIEAFVEPIRITADYLKRLSEGDIPDQVAKEYNGEFNEIIASLNELIRALNVIGATAEEMAKNNLSVNIQPRSERDELLKSLSKMVTNLNSTLHQINTGIDQVAAAAGQVADSSQSLSQGATEQASALEEITSSMSQIASQVKENAENAAQANQLATEARTSAEHGNERMKEMVSSMKEINEASQNIANINKVIDEIAFQTNLLALNAAVEAARAGKHGKGFAVVAEEVRNLAARSAKAAKETAEMIESSMKKVEGGMNIAAKTAEALNEIMESVTKVTDLIAEISAASNEQTQAIEQVSEGLSQIDQVTQQNAANAQETASASEELSGQAGELKEMVGAFKLVEIEKTPEFNISSLTPEMIAMLKEMLNNHNSGSQSACKAKPEKGNGDARGDGWDQLANNSAGNMEQEPTIVLDSTEFGKY